MKTCKDCIHYEVCKAIENEFDMIPPSQCDCSKDKSRYIELPCKIGDTVYILYDDDYGEYVITEFCIGTLQELRFFAKCGISGYKNIQDCPEYYCGQPFCSTSFLCQDFGKTVFLSRVEAEKALTERSKE